MIVCWRIWDRNLSGWMALEEGSFVTWCNKRDLQCLEMWWDFRFSVRIESVSHRELSQVSPSTPGPRLRLLREQALATPGARCLSRMISIWWRAQTALFLMPAHQIAFLSTGQSLNYEKVAWAHHRNEPQRSLQNKSTRYSLPALLLRSLKFFWETVKMKILWLRELSRFISRNERLFRRWISVVLITYWFQR